MLASYVALLRGIKVGGKNPLPMKDLIGIFAESGCEQVKSYIRSGNVIFDAAPEVAARVPGTIAARFGYRTPVVQRTAWDLVGVVGKNPFLGAGCAEDEVQVYLLADRPDPRRVGQLDPGRSPPARFEVRGREIYPRLPNGKGRTKLTHAYFDSELATIGTGRTWRTITRLLELPTS